MSEKKIFFLTFCMLQHTFSEVIVNQITIGILMRRKRKRLVSNQNVTIPIISNKQMRLREKYTGLVKKKFLTTNVFFQSWL